MKEPLSHDFYFGDVEDVARAMLGKQLVRVTANGMTAGRIVEVEAYLSRQDPANHGHRGQTRRNATMFGTGGHAYVYSIHARYCLNAVTEPEGVPCAVLIRAVEPLEGLDLMRERRRRTNVLDLARGPARLCEAFGIDRSLDGWDLTRGEELWLADEDGTTVNAANIAVAQRVGVSAGADLPLRFFMADSRFVSKRPRQPKS